MLRCLAVELEACDWVFVGGFGGRIYAEEYTYDQTDSASNAKDLP